MCAQKHSKVPTMNYEVLWFSPVCKREKTTKYPKIPGQRTDLSAKPAGGSFLLYMVKIRSPIQLKLGASGGM